jgi:cell division protein FtsZ
MASPLLEAGAIDGARGILINITGSSTLKLNEVNEASTLIQSAAHEDANIIFGAVLDEAMGEDVKITVIATGFKQQGSAERRDHMLSAALRAEEVTARIAPRPATPRFASEEPDEMEIAPAAVTRMTPPGPVFVPVTAREVISAFAPTVERPREVEPLRGEPLFYEMEEAEANENAVAVAVVPEAAPTGGFAAVAPALFEPEGGEDLDVPAFLRKGGM